jgi:GNAT superfamily N-acetyltransferase
VEGSHLRGQGLSRRLLQHAISQARSIGAKSWLDKWSSFNGCSGVLANSAPLVAVI